MKLSAPVYNLKRKAKLLSRQDNIALHEALDRIALEEGFSSWSLLVAKVAAIRPAAKLFARLTPGDLVLLGARPGNGKTLMSLELAVEAMRSGHRGAFFSLEYTEREVLDCFKTIEAEPGGLFELDVSDAICADYIVEKMATAPRGTLVVIDYLQLLDQRRENPPLAEQVPLLRSFAREKGLIFVLISQIDRSYDPSRKELPDLRDIRLPNPLNLKLFDKTCFLSHGKVSFRIDPRGN